MTSVDPLAEFYAEQTTNQCRVAALLAQLDADKAAGLRAALAVHQQRLQHVAVVRTVRKWGHDLSKDAVRRHRVGECTCAR